MEQNYLAPHPAAVEQYQRLYAQHGDTIRALGWPDEHRCRIRYDALGLVLPYQARILDYGCGLAHFHEHIMPRRTPTQYTGADVVPEFIKANEARNLPRANFVLVRSAQDLIGTWPYIVACGVFSYRVLPPSAHELHVKQNLKALFERCSVSMHVDFLAPDPDPEYRKPELFNMSIHTLINWLKEIGCRRYIIDRSYLPFEYCVHMFKEQEIARPANVYAKAAP